jgi:hypothetical protein
MPGLQQVAVGLLPHKRGVAAPPVVWLLQLLECLAQGSCCCCGQRDHDLVVLADMRQPDQLPPIPACAYSTGV